METLLKSLDHPQSNFISTLIVILGLILVGTLTYYVFMPFSDIVINELQQGSSRVGYTSL